MQVLDEIGGLSEDPRASEVVMCLKKYIRQDEATRKESGSLGPAGMSDSVTLQGPSAPNADKKPLSEANNNAKVTLPSHPIPSEFVSFSSLLSFFPFLYS